MKPRLIVEPFLNMEEFIDYKFFVIDGKVEYFAIVKNINDEDGLQSTDARFNLYYPNLKPFDGDVGRKKFNDSNFQFSIFVNDMIKIAEDLSKPFVYCRVDFLVSKEQIIFGEMTLFPNGGAMVLKPLSLKYYYGEKLNLENVEKTHVY
nr:ATP-grasp fold amidoligase family protein [Staphylococcus saprophyticus]